MLLGLILAGQAGATDWDTYSQKSIIADVLKDFPTPLTYDGFALSILLPFQFCSTQTQPQQSQVTDLWTTVVTCRYALHGPPANWTNVIGYDTTNYNKNTAPIDVSKVSGVFAGE